MLDGTMRGTATCSESAAIMGVSPARPGAMPITADALTAEIAAVKRRRIGHAQQEQLARFEAAAKLGWQRPAQPVGRQRGGRRHAVDLPDDANVLRRDCAHTFEQRNAGRQVAALRSRMAALSGSGTTMLSTDNGRGSEAVRRSSGSMRYQPTATLSDGL